MPLLRLLQVLCTTSTLAMGVNLPAHLVVIKSTRRYVGSEAEDPTGYEEYERSTCLQMVGRAGRPQFGELHGQDGGVRRLVNHDLGGRADSDWERLPPRRHGGRGRGDDAAPVGAAVRAAGQGVGGGGEHSEGAAARVPERGDHVEDDHRCFPGHRLAQVHLPLRAGERAGGLEEISNIWESPRNA